MRIFICDKCNTEFPEPLDQEMYKDEHAVWHTFDLCAPCRKNMKTEQNTFLNSLAKDVNKKIKLKEELIDG